MKVQKYEITRVIDKLKSIVQKNDQFPALGGILVKDGYLIASNSEITMKVKLEASEGSYFIIPMKAFDLIKNLPDGEIDISATDKNAMEAEGKIQYGNVTESTTVTTDGDTCGFDIEVIDLDSAEHIYLNYYFQFSTIVAASGE